MKKKKIKKASAGGCAQHMTLISIIDRRFL